MAQNLSEGGLFIATEKEVPPGTLVQLRFTVPGPGVPIETLAEVRWRRERSGDLPAGIGVRFVDLDAEAASAIAGFVQEREPYRYDEAAQRLERPVGADELLEAALPAPGARRLRRLLAIVVVGGATTLLVLGVWLFAHRLGQAATPVPPAATSLPAATGASPPASHAAPTSQVAGPSSAPASAPAVPPVAPPEGLQQ